MTAFCIHKKMVKAAWGPSQKEENGLVLPGTRIRPKPYKEKVASSLFTPMDNFFTAMADRGASQ